MMEPRKFDANTLARGWLSVALFTSKDDAHPILTGMLVEEHDDGIRLVATDSYALLVAWVPSMGANEVPPPALDEAPRSTAVVLDPYGRGAGLMAHLLKVTSGKDALVLDLTVSIAPDPRDGDQANLEGTAPDVLCFDLPGQELLTLPIHEGQYPAWRDHLAGFKAAKTDRIAFAPEVVVARLGKLGKLHAEHPLVWEFGGAEGPARVSILEGFPACAGLVMPVRVSIPNLE